jgi:ATP-binding cassette subfamily F protein 3
VISVEGLKVEFGVKPLFSDATFVINDKDRIALVGKNGAGKSTMLKILCGMEKPTAGMVSVASETTIGYLPQVMILQDNTSVRQEAQKAFADIQKMADRIARMEKQLSERTDYESDDYMALVEKFTAEHERYQMLGAEGYEAEIERTLMGLGFERTDFDRPTSEFSGGWRMRIELAKILLRRPDVLLLDEPTSYLDIRYQIELLETLRHLAQARQVAIVLSLHDLSFARQVSDWLVCIKDDGVLAQGTPNKICRPSIINELYDLRPGSFDPTTGTIVVGPHAHTKGGAASDDACSPTVNDLAHAQQKGGDHATA